MRIPRILLVAALAATVTQSPAQAGDFGCHVSHGIVDLVSVAGDPMDPGSARVEITTSHTCTFTASGGLIAYWCYLGPGGQCSIRSTGQQLQPIGGGCSASTAPFVKYCQGTFGPALAGATVTVTVTNGSASAWNCSAECGQWQNRELP